MNYKKKSLIFSISIIIIIQALLVINNNQKSSFRYFIWNVKEVSIGSLIAISFMSGFIMSSILLRTQDNYINRNQLYEEEDLSNDLNNYSRKIDNNNDSYEIPPERDVRDTQPTISVNYRVIRNNGENEVIDREQISNSQNYQDDWENNEREW